METLGGVSGLGGGGESTSLADAHHAIGSQHPGQGNQNLMGRGWKAGCEVKPGPERTNNYVPFGSPRNYPHLATLSGFFFIPAFALTSPFPTHFFPVLARHLLKAQNRYRPPPFGGLENKEKIINGGGLKVGENCWLDPPWAGGGVFSQSNTLVTMKTNVKPNPYSSTWKRSLWNADSPI